MHLLFDILYAAHANGTHKKLAMDALNHLHGEDAPRRRQIFLKHYEPYLRGSKDPDTKFKDFRNHVLHVEQEYWGGAEKTARKWYDNLVEALRSQRWKEAAYNAGVLSHYFSDPLMPFHTAQSEAENNIHRAVEWSISCSYDRLRASAELRGQIAVRVPEGSDWLEQMVRDGAERSHQQYQVLIDHYNFKAGRRNPPRGLDVVCRDAVAPLLGHAIGGFARILERAFEESACHPPRMLLVVETVFATIEVPMQWVTNRIESKEEAEQIRQMYREYQKTGKVERTLPEDVRAVRDELVEEEHVETEETEASQLSDRYQLPEVSLSSLSRKRSRSFSSPKEIKSAKPQKSELTMSRRQESSVVESYRIEPTKIDPPKVERSLEKASPSLEPALNESRLDKEVTPDESTTDKFQPTKEVKIRPKMPPKKKSVARNEPREDVTATVKMPRSTEARDERETSREEDDVPAKLKQNDEASTRDRSRAIEDKKPVEAKSLKFYLEGSDPVADAPSIGNKTAKRLGGVGIRTVAQLIAADPDAIAPKLKVKHITPQILEEWQAQAVLVCRIPMLRGHDAQLLTACGYEEPEAVARADAETVLIEVEEFAETSAGQRILRSSEPPDLAEVKNWIAWAGQARRLQAA